MRTRQGETIYLGERIRPASADFPPVGGVWGRNAGGFLNHFFQKRILNFVFQNASPRNYLNIITPTIYEQKFITNDNNNNFLVFSRKTQNNNLHSIKTTINSNNKIINKFVSKKEK